MEDRLNTPCPCSKLEKKIFRFCCYPYHIGKEKPETAEDLMRSRYSAFVFSNTSYLKKSWHPQTRPKKFTSNDLDHNVLWVGLEIIGNKFINKEKTKASVEFKAKMMKNNRPEIHHELSIFEKISGEWFYLLGDQL